MFRVFILYLTVISQFLFIPIAQSATVQSENNNHTILVVGDSISAAYGMNTNQGWVYLLSNKITQSKKRYQVINASISGDTSAGALNRLPALLEKYHPRIVVIEIGGNDGLRGLSIKAMRKNISLMVEQSLQQGADIILAGMKIPPNFGRKYTDTFFSSYPLLSEQYKTALIPFLLEGIGDQPSLMQADGIHPNAQAQPRIMEIVWKTLEPML